MNTKIFVLAVVSVLLGLLVACESAETPQPEMANPASENCIAQGGTLSFEIRGDGGQYGVCTFEDNQQCEEWALVSSGRIPTQAEVMEWLAA